MADSSTRIVNQQWVSDLREARLDNVDVLLAAATWDDRCRIVESLPWGASLRRVIMLSYKDKGVSGRVEANEASLSASLTQATDTPLTWLDVDTDDINGSWKRVRQAVLEAYQSAGRPVRIAVDINSVPRFISLALLGLGARSGLISTYTALYAVATRYQSDGLTPLVRFTEGAWLPISIATLGSGASPSSRSHLVVSAGFEGNHTRRLVHALEPDRVSLVINNDVSPDFTLHARQANARLAEEYLLESKDIVWSPSTNMREAVRLLQLHIGQSMATETPSAPEAVSFLLCGTKSASLAMAIASLDSPIAQVYYASPERRLETNVGGIAGCNIVEVKL